MGGRVVRMEVGGGPTHTWALAWRSSVRTPCPPGGRSGSAASTRRCPPTPGQWCHTTVHSDTNQWFFNQVDNKRQVTRVLLILALVVSRTVNLEGTGCVLDGWTRWLLSVLRVAQTSK